MSTLVARAAAMAERAQGYARERMSELQQAAGSSGAPFIPYEWRALVERELASAFTLGWAARDEQTAVGRLPGPKRKRTK